MNRGAIPRAAPFVCNSERAQRDLGISTSRACQIHRRALERLRAMLEGMKAVPGRAA